MIMDITTTGTTPGPGPGHSRATTNTNTTITISNASGWGLLINCKVIIFVNFDEIFVVCECRLV